MDEKNSQTLFMLVMRRNWSDLVQEITRSYDAAAPDDLLDRTFLKGGQPTNITLRDCFAKNMQLLKHSKNADVYELLASKIKGFREIEEFLQTEYDVKDFQIKADDNGKKHSAFEVFFDNEIDKKQPILNVQEIEQQKLASKQLMKHDRTMVLDEVGTGKTVAALYAMQKVIQNTASLPLSILVVCPYSKRSDWYSDVSRQLGRKAIIIDQNDDGHLQKNYIHHRMDIPNIFIMGSKSSKENSDGKNSQLKGSFKDLRNAENANDPAQRWDLVIIDECHECFDSYSGIQAKRVMLLTATPICVNSTGDTFEVRDFRYYTRLMNDMLGSESDKAIDPIKIPNPDEDDIFVCNFKEDIFKNLIISRSIEYIECERDPRRKKWFDQLKAKGILEAMHADQDDTYLAYKARSECQNSIFTEDDFRVESNHKLNKLVDFLKEHQQSWIIFCESTFVVDLIYDTLVKKLASAPSDKQTLIGKKHGRSGEIYGETKNPFIIFEKLKSHIRNKKGRAVLVTTGKSGGTGLNLGEFDGVIHYELPFTSNDLEQRYGRVERTDDLIRMMRSHSTGDNSAKEIQKKMVFFVNAPTSATDGATNNEHSIALGTDFDSNRMLYYCVSKIGITYRHMPVRNTVLFSKDFIKRQNSNLKAVVNYFDEVIPDDVYKQYIEYKQQEYKAAETVRIILDKAANDPKIEAIKNETNLLDQIAGLIKQSRTFFENHNLEEELKQLHIFCKYRSSENGELPFADAVVKFEDVGLKEKDFKNLSNPCPSWLAAYKDIEIAVETVLSYYLELKQMMKFIKPNSEHRKGENENPLSNPDEQMEDQMQEQMENAEEQMQKREDQIRKLAEKVLALKETCIRATASDSACGAEFLSLFEKIGAIKKGENGYEPSSFNEQTSQGIFFEADGVISNLSVNDFRNKENHDERYYFGKHSSELSNRH